MIGLALLAFAAFLLVSSALAPLEALGWWAGWRGGRRELPAPAPGGPDPEVTHYLVYLSGIAAISGDSIADEENRFLDRLQETLPGTRIVRDVFPYSVSNTGLNSGRLFAWFWRRLERLRLRRPRAVVGLLIHLRNMFQVGVSADQRYGPIFNFGAAEEILAGLRRAGHTPGSRVPITLLGWSGGAQISLGATPFLAKALGTPVQIVSVGGIMTADPGLLRVRHLWHLYGTRDRVQRWGGLLFPGRWHMSVASPWNRAREEGRVDEIAVGPMEHRMPRSYFDDGNRLPDGRTYADHTLEVITRVLGDSGVATREAGTVD
ncbi:MAG: hypothetical protein EA350_10765 [Gemmatimonadales bacterium]|nr:MAG: hypothetical protein EA350_10765 [Gemmatimonadales bacterium]